MATYLHPWGICRPFNISVSRETSSMTSYLHLWGICRPSNI
uniref:Uncharacterized protein n=1 Tax=Populus trichocarpa TaxID=3694 RepID=A9PFC0_POPTR|nr:unknown [Populus trichocarpa]